MRKEHGPHLPLGTDRLLADYLAARIAERVPAVIAPVLTYGYYPALAVPHPQYRDRHLPGARGRRARPAAGTAGSWSA
jgi:hypothetical protein